MPKLPENSVKAPPMFDSPFRRTSGPSLAAVPAEPAPEVATEEPVPPEQGRAGQGEATASVAPVSVEAPSVEPVGTKPAKAKAKTKPKQSRARKPAVPAPAPGEVELSHRLTARLTAEQYEKIENECHRRRLAGDRQVSAAVLLREIVEQWRP